MPGKNIRRLRLSRGLSQRELARRAGCTGSHINQVERGRVSPSLKRLRRIANILEVPVAELLAGERGGEKE